MGGRTVGNAMNFSQDGHSVQISITKDNGILVYYFITLRITLN
jgi:hypothetical protein